MPKVAMTDFVKNRPADVPDAVAYIIVVDHVAVHPGDGVLFDRGVAFVALIHRLKVIVPIQGGIRAQDVMQPSGYLETVDGGGVGVGLLKHEEDFLLDFVVTGIAEFTSSSH